MKRVNTNERNLERGVLMKTPRLRTALLGSGAAIALLAVSGPVAADEIDELRAQINALQWSAP